MTIRIVYEYKQEWQSTSFLIIEYLDELAFFELSIQPRDLVAVLFVDLVPLVAQALAWATSNQRIEGGWSSWTYQNTMGREIIWQKVK